MSVRGTIKSVVFGFLFALSVVQPSHAQTCGDCTVPNGPVLESDGGCYGQAINSACGAPGSGGTCVSDVRCPTGDSTPACGCATGHHGRFLPAAAGSARVQTYGGVGGGGRPDEFDADVRDSHKTIDAGTVRFTYDTYVGPAGAVPLTQGGARLSGGFYQNRDVNVKHGFKLMWVQVVRDATTTGGDAVLLWNLPATGAPEYPDAGTGNKKYAFQNAMGVPFGLAPKLGYQDTSGRSLAQNQTWRGELGLVCIEDADVGGDGFFDARVVGTFRWGFSIANQPPPARGIEDVTGNAPNAWAAPSPSYLNTLNGFYSGTGGGGGTQRRCTAPAGSVGKICVLNIDCDSPPGGGGDGRCVTGAPVPSTKYRFAANDNCFEESPLISCPDGTCTPTEGENPCTCPEDCPGDCPFCGDGFCQPPFETACECPDDCLGDCPGCGDGFCDETEAAECTCRVDCGDCPFCGDGICDPNESETTCAIDCAGATDSIPTVSQWGLAALALLLLVGAKSYFGRRRHAGRTA